MHIGNYRHTPGELLPLNKWLFSIEILWCPPYMIGVFKPVLFIIAMKVLEHGDVGRVYGKEMQYRGFWRRYTAPRGISVSIDLV